jgi:UDP-2-acetamido-2,6-beta-L-arabino-hexul-4-ose reductase
MKRIGITGQPGFIGTHLFNYLALRKDEYELVHFEDSYFDKDHELCNFVKECDCIIHLAALNRHRKSEVIYETNINLVRAIISALEKTKSKPHVIFSSSTQEEQETLYGKSKKEGRELLQAWAETNNAHYSALIIPNVFGPFGKPFYNSVIATFSYQLTHTIEPNIEIDATLKLIYIHDLLNEFVKVISTELPSNVYYVPFYKEVKVSEILKTLTQFKEKYIQQNIIPPLSDKYEVDLFNTFRSYIDLKSYYPYLLKKNEDSRGFLVETLKEHSGGQTFFSVTKPGITRGNHFHLRKIERFCVLKGKALIKLRKVGTTEVHEFIIDGNVPSIIDMPVWYTHNIKNIGSDELLTLFWSNEFYNSEDSDTFIDPVETKTL